MYSAGSSPKVNFVDDACLRPLSRESAPFLKLNEINPAQLIFKELQRDLFITPGGTKKTSLHYLQELAQMVRKIEIFGEVKIGKLLLVRE